MVKWLSALQLALAISLGVTWYFTPLFTAYSSGVYAQRLMLTGVVVYFLGRRYVHIPLILPIASVAFLVTSGIPVLIRDSEFNRSYSFLMAVAGLSLVVSAVIWQLSYLRIHGYIITPVPNGYFYMALPIAYSIGPPLYLLIAVVVISIMNMLRPTLNVGVRRALIHEVLKDAEREGPIKAVAKALSKLGVPYEVKDGKLYVNGVEVVSSDVKLNEELVKLTLAKSLISASKMRSSDQV